MMLTTPITNLSLILKVFREGLRLGIISQQEVIAWSDSIIAKFDEPDYLFIELSLNSDKNNLIALINEYVVTSDNPICVRVLLGRVNEQMVADDDVSQFENIARLVGKLQNRDAALTGFESGKIFQFDDYEILYLPDTTQLKVDLFCFLDIYKPFTLENYNQWDEINIQVLGILKEEEAKENIANASIRKRWEQRDEKRKLKKFLFRCIPLLFLLVWVVIIYITSQNPSNYPADNSLWEAPRSVAFIYILYKGGGYLLKRAKQKA